MRRITLFVIAVLFIGGCQKTFMAVDAEKAKLSNAQLQEVSRAERLGKELYEMDTTAAKATHMMLQVAGQIPPGVLSGWIIVKENNRTLTRFIKQTGEDINVVYDVWIDSKGGSEVRRDNLRPLSNTEIAMFYARQNAMLAAPKNCTRAYNTAVIKDPDSDGWLVYILAATSGNVIVVGGHSRVKVSPDGKNVESVTPLYDKCLAMPVPVDVKDPKKEAFSVSYPIADVPSEIHVYLNYLHEYTVYVTTTRGTWRVRDGRIAVIKNAATTKSGKRN
jgi:hypothetical protein